MARKHLQQQAVVSRLQGRNDRSPLLMSNYLSEHQLNLWQQDGCLKIGDYFTESQKQELLAWGANG
jgi:hypothetical protein